MSETQETQQVNLPIHVLENIVKIIDFFVEKNMSGGWEVIMGIKQNRDSLVEFLNSIPRPEATEENVEQTSSDSSTYSI